ncbi:MAG: type III secretion system cytoplasmic ring protein SctQ [Candidatus Protochlamydia sp.]|nr:type III secretion system cytoplasmic ring protein SctQ [Candidatus Protochlamydia sp.]
MTTPPPASSFDWLRTISPELKNLDESPLTGNSPPFPWEDLALRLGKSFEREGLRIEPRDLNWRSSSELYEGLGDSPFPLTFAIPTFKGDVCWVMPEQEMTLLETWLLTKESDPLNFQDRSLSESFYRFFALEALYHLSQLPFDKTIAPILTSQKGLPSEASLCLDIALSFKAQTVWGRLIISPAARRSWVEHFAGHASSHLTQELAKAVEVRVHLEAGKTQLTLKDWSSVELGDLILLDSCTLEPPEFTGRVMLTVNGKTAFRGKIKEHSLKILELPVLQEINTPLNEAGPPTKKVNSPMEKSMHDDDEDEDDLSDLDFTEDEDSFTLDDPTDEEEDEDFPDESQKTAREQSTATSAVPGASQSKLLVPGEIPVTLTVEVGCIQMSMDQLLRLEPGNLLEINVNPANGVDLTINGKVVGKGELLKIGEALGVRVVELGQ